MSDRTQSFRIIRFPEKRYLTYAVIAPYHAPSILQSYDGLTYELLIICLRWRTRNSIHCIHALASAMANADQVARALNRFSDNAFLNALSERDRGAMTDLVEVFL